MCLVPLMQIIYLDTNIWNKLFEQNAGPDRLLNALNARNANLAISGQTVYELAKTFAKAPEKAIKLFQYLKPYVERGVIFARDNMEQLHGEVDALMNGSSGVAAFCAPNEREYGELKAEVDRLAQGIFDQQAQQFIANRQQFAATTRSDQKIHFDDKPETKARLQAVSSDQLPTWLDQEVVTNIGAAILTDHLRRIYSNVPTATASQVAQTLLHIPQSRIAKGIVRADLYYNWRCANRDSNPPDLVDDMYHVLNASYCSVYATAEARQDAYASLLLSRWTRGRDL